MNKQQYASIKSSEWMYSNSCDFMNIKMSTPIYRVYEYVYINVAATFKIDYRDLIKENNKEENYIPKAISILLLDRIFRNIYAMQEQERQDMIGYNYRFVEDFRRFNLF